MKVYLIRNWHPYEGTYYLTIKATEEEALTFVNSTFSVGDFNKRNSTKNLYVTYTSIFGPKEGKIIHIWLAKGTKENTAERIDIAEWEI